jgi:peptidoglycan/LPS O-acetylase OafA/YrhL
VSFKAGDGLHGLSLFLYLWLNLAMENRIRELDSLRAVAVCLVIAFHVFKRAAYFTKHETLHFISSLAGVGWLGVDIFFVLSGFLITSILLKTRQENNYFKNFYMRRALRIFPLYFTFILVILALLPLLDPPFVSQVPHALPFLLLYQQNWMSTFGDNSLTPYLAVTWSLAIEEQFYLLWPAVVYFAPKPVLVRISIGIIVLSITARVMGVLFWDDPARLAGFFYYNTFTRFEQLIFGALLAIGFADPTWRERLRLASWPVFMLAFGGFAVLCIIQFPGIIPYYSNPPLTLAGYTLVAIFSAAFIAILMTSPPDSMLRRVFQNKGLSFMGTYSYSMYLLHMPVALLLLQPLYDTRIRGWKMYLLYIALTYGLTLLGALLTWHLLEKHMLNLKRHFAYKQQEGTA